MKNINSTLELFADIQDNSSSLSPYLTHPDIQVMDAQGAKPNAIKKRLIQLRDADEGGDN